MIGEFGGDRNTFGITGISPDAFVRAVSLVTNSTAQAIRIAADLLQPGDIILLEVHRPGPQAANGNGQFGFIAIEWWPDDFAAIRYAVSRGVIVVEAAGNGGQNLDDPIYNTPQTGFPSTWTNPFNPANPSSSAVVAGAGMPPAGTHGRNFQPGWGDVYADRGRCFFSNYGARVDAQGWGWEVTSTGYGDLQGGSDQNMWYTDQFSGTSSASPIVVGALACVQGVLRAHGRALLTSDRAIALLRDTGSPQEDGPAFTFIPNMAGTGYPQNHPARPRTQRIGNRPDLRQLINVAMMVPWNYNDLTMASGAPVAAGDPAGYTWDIDHTQHVVYRGIDSHIHELWFNGQWNHNDLTLATGTPVAASDPDGYTWDMDSTQHVVYKGIDSHIHELWFNGQWNHNDLTLAAGAPLALGRPAGYTWDVDHTQHVVYKGLDSHIHELWFNNQWNHNDLTMAATAPLAVGDPAGYTWDVDRTQHVVFRGTGSHIHELWFNGQWNHNDLTLAAVAPVAVGDPDGYTWDVDSTQRVVYRGTDSHIHALWFH